MKLAEALIVRADLQTRQEQLRQRLRDNALVQEGEEPAEDPVVLLEEVERNALRLEELITRINLTNAATVLDGKSLTELLARREALTQRISIFQSLLESASKTVMRGSHSEVRICSTVDVRSLRKQADDLSAQLRALDTAIQSSNWTVELQ